VDSQDRLVQRGKSAILETLDLRDPRDRGAHLDHQGPLEGREEQDFKGHRGCRDSLDHRAVLDRLERQGLVGLVGSLGTWDLQARLDPWDNLGLLERQEDRGLLGRLGDLDLLELLVPLVQLDSLDQVGLQDLWDHRDHLDSLANLVLRGPSVRLVHRVLVGPLEIQDQLARMELVALRERGESLASKEILDQADQPDQMDQGVTLARQEGQGLWAFRDQRVQREPRGPLELAVRPDPLGGPDSRAPLEPLGPRDKEVKQVLSGPQVHKDRLGPPGWLDNKERLEVLVQLDC
jgi:hypothetical protein